MAKTTHTTIAIPAGISVTYTHHTLTLTKNGKSVHKELSTPEVKVETHGQEVKLTPANERRLTFATLNAYESHVKNLVQGLEKGYTYKLAVVHSHFPMNIKVKGDIVEISNYLGEKNPRLSKIVGKETKVDIKGKDITVTGNNLEDVSQTAANMEKATRDVKKDQRVFQDGIYITSKGVPA
ncbi:MAG: 50S ribosomal protein L6 [Candidatus Diapherotrites archaeon]|uniref:50S ribosomal protein L6 n=1 Tax=Candidatus Iainarchaeum sp. TaxID=3101447 RepID=A0A8T4C5R3_9ARCH|nr:50S ribosomal protein L6 [Candidatus Diapherotrites archaeon]